jgi:hypothetical protein
LQVIVQVLITLVLIGTLAYQAWAQTCSSPGTTVFFVNGVNNDFEQAKFSRDKLEEKLKAHIPGTPIQSECLEFVLAYNNNENHILDFIEAADQVLAGEMLMFWRFWANLDIAPDWFQQAASDIAMGIDANSYVVDADLQEHVQQYRTEILGGNKVVAVAHSQGNLYANEAYSFLFDPVETDSFGIVSVATPAGSVAGSVAGEEPYTTLYGDFIWLVPGALPPNTLEDCGNDVWFCHSFVHTYLKGSVSKPQILNDIVDVILSLKRPELPPNLPANFTQHKSDGITVIPFGGTTNENTVVTKGGVSDPDGDDAQLEVEVQQVGSNFLGTPNCVSDPAVASGQTATATCSGLTDGLYHWQARAKDVNGAVSAWVPAGGNLESEADFVVEAALTLASGLSFPLLLTVDQNSVYWTERAETVKKVGLNGGVVTTLAASVGSPFSATGVVVDAVSVYWAVGYSGSSGNIYKIPIAGGTKTTLAFANQPYDVAVDATHVYWAEANGGTLGSNSVRKVPINEGAVITLHPGGTLHGVMAIDDTHVYFRYSDGFVWKIAKVDKNGESVIDLASNVGSFPAGIAVDANSVYWTEENAGNIKKVSINGGTVATLASGLVKPQRIAVDENNVYFIELGNKEPGAGAIKVVSINGGEVITLADGLNYPTGVVVDDVSLYWTEQGTDGTDGAIKKILK